MFEAVRRSFLIAAVLFAMLLAALAAMMAPRKKEPVHDGRPLSYWITANDPGASNAICEIGTNAIPYLIDWMQYREPRLLLLLRREYNKRSPLKWEHEASRRASLAPHAFNNLGPNSVFTVAPLMNLITSNPEVRFSAIAAFTKMGALGIPPMQACLTNADPSIRRDAAFLSMSFRSDAELLIPALIRVANETNEYMSLNALQTLARLHAEPQMTAQLLIKHLKARYPNARYSACLNLGRLGPSASNAIPSLTATLADPDEGVRAEARKALQQIRSSVN